MPCHCARIKCSSCNEFSLNDFIGFCQQSHEVRLTDLAKGFEEATIDKNQQEEKTKMMKKKLETAAQLRKVCALCQIYSLY